MALAQEKKELISVEVIKTLYLRFENFPENSDNNRNAPFHKAFLNAFSDKFEGKVSDIPFFVSLSSWLHGLNTTLGQSFFEKVAHILSDGQKKGFTKNDNTLLKITKKQKDNIADIITDLKNGNEQPNLKRESNLIFINEGEEIEANNFTADVFIEDYDKIICVELKSVKPNAGEMRGEKQKILEAKAALYHSYPEKKIEFYIGFPFDPTSKNETTSDKDKFLSQIIDGKKYYDFSEVKLANELWDFLSSDTNTMQQILDIINSIAKPDFKEKYSKLIDPTINLEEKRKILTGWNIFSEVKLIEENETIISKINGNKRLQRIYNQDIFITGKYNHERSIELLSLIN
ncbi:TdeIII family type II restriction endonuclease [candidate division KSB1 bacterium]|nr:MAG: TdeIII family type II restriction endonuclease [candidate division KSB1 bacterium]